MDELVRHNRPPWAAWIFKRAERERSAPRCFSDALDVDLLRNRESVVDFDPEISSRAFDLAMPQEKLNGAEIASSPIDQSSFRSAKRMGAEELGIQSDFGNPSRNKSPYCRVDIDASP